MTVEMEARSVDSSDLLTADEVAARLKVQPSWVMKAARANRIPYVPVGRYTRFSWPDVEAWLRSQKRGTATAAGSNIISPEP